MNFISHPFQNTQTMCNFKPSSCFFFFFLYYLKSTQLKRQLCMHYFTFPICCFYYYYSPVSLLSAIAVLCYVKFTGLLGPKFIVLFYYMHVLLMMMRVNCFRLLKSKRHKKKWLWLFTDSLTVTVTVASKIHKK